MKRKKALLAFMAAAVFLCQSLTTGFAADKYSVEELSLPAETARAQTTGEFIHLGNILVQDDGSLDAFTETRRGETRNLFHHRSTDGGKTWTDQNDTGWFKTYENLERDFVTDGKGNFYFTAFTKDFLYEDADMTANLEMTSLLCLSGGKVTVIKEFGQRPENPQILAYGPDGLAMFSRVAAATDGPDYRFLLVDPAAGTEKINRVLNGVMPREYANGMVSGWNDFTFVTVNEKQPECVGRETDKRLWITLDAATGRETRKLANPLDHRPNADTDYEAFGSAAAPDGTVYFVSVDGFYRLKPDGRSFEKLLDGAAAGITGTRRCSGFSAGKNGDFYAVTGEWDASKSDPELKLLHYIPA